MASFAKKPEARGANAGPRPLLKSSGTARASAPSGAASAYHLSGAKGEKEGKEGKGPATGTRKLALGSAALRARSPPIKESSAGGPVMPVPLRHGKETGGLVSSRGSGGMHGLSGGLSGGGHSLMTSRGPGARGAASHITLKPAATGVGKERERKVVGQTGVSGLRGERSSLIAESASPSAPLRSGSQGHREGGGRTSHNSQKERDRLPRSSGSEAGGAGRRGVQEREKAEVEEGERGGRSGKPLRASTQGTASVRDDHLPRSGGAGQKHQSGTKDRERSSVAAAVSSVSGAPTMGPSAKPLTPVLSDQRERDRRGGPLGRDGVSRRNLIMAGGASSTRKLPAGANVSLNLLSSSQEKEKDKGESQAEKQKGRPQEPPPSNGSSNAVSKNQTQPGLPAEKEKERDRQKEKEDPGSSSDETVTATATAADTTPKVLPTPSSGGEEPGASISITNVEKGGREKEKESDQREKGSSAMKQKGSKKEISLSLHKESSPSHDAQPQADGFTKPKKEKEREKEKHRLKEKEEREREVINRSSPPSSFKIQSSQSPPHSNPSKAVVDSTPNPVTAFSADVHRTASKNPSAPVLPSRTGPAQQAKQAQTQPPPYAHVLHPTRPGSPFPHPVRASPPQGAPAPTPASSSARAAAAGAGTAEEEASERQKEKKKTAMGTSSPPVDPQSKQRHSASSHAAGMSKSPTERGTPSYLHPKERHTTSPPRIAPAISERPRGSDHASSSVLRTPLPLPLELSGKGAPIPFPLLHSGALPVPVPVQHFQQAQQQQQQRPASPSLMDPNRKKASPPAAHQLVAATERRRDPQEDKKRPSASMHSFAPPMRTTAGKGADLQTGRSGGTPSGTPSKAQAQTGGEKEDKDKRRAESASTPKKGTAATPAAAPTVRAQTARLFPNERVPLQYKYDTGVPLLEEFLHGGTPDDLHAAFIFRPLEEVKRIAKERGPLVLSLLKQMDLIERPPPPTPPGGWKSHIFSSVCLPTENRSSSSSAGASATAASSSSAQKQQQQQGEREQIDPVGSIGFHIQTVPEQSAAQLPPKRKERKEGERFVELDLLPSWLKQLPVNRDLIPTSIDWSFNEASPMKREMRRRQLLATTEGVPETDTLMQYHDRASLEAAMEGRRIVDFPQSVGLAITAKILLNRTNMSVVCPYGTKTCLSPEPKTQQQQQHIVHYSGGQYIQVGGAVYRHGQPVFPAYNSANYSGAAYPYHQYYQDQYGNVYPHPHMYQNQQQAQYAQTRMQPPQPSAGFPPHAPNGRSQTLQEQQQLPGSAFHPPNAAATATGGGGAWGLSSRAPTTAADPRQHPPTAYAQMPPQHPQQHQPHQQSQFAQQQQQQQMQYPHQQQQPDAFVPALHHYPHHYPHPLQDRVPMQHTHQPQRQQQQAQTSMSVLQPSAATAARGQLGIPFSQSFAPSISQPPRVQQQQTQQAVGGMGGMQGGGGGGTNPPDSTRPGAPRGMLHIPAHHRASAAAAPSTVGLLGSGG
uniref:Uncharacterized protein n=1 Tax=Chromera velia CCMP2878 TaxID=1169474 RepID=A0A0G4F6P7_9ALVE|eukprot:Cvel_15356.t1-p1 / transcript=Cvel_15356.t1 / gene=Cvel_15356 / organism=Chromera_velia_CCMP2878 / gene_product=hypothetical protein / transcript_product=hypothetical protein / location=Cvel_scaffold1131:11177-19206(-) / protein_length=1488 / sequence_SO=supercontig / SO=protein_coding / is_pseudo=false